MTVVSLGKRLPFNDAGQAYARMLARYLTFSELPPYLGNIGRFERNPKSIESGIWKLHIRMLDDEGWKPALRQQDRKSNNFLIYAQHWDCRDHYQILAILSPDAHETVDRILPALINAVENEFHALSESQLKELLHISA